MYRHGIKACGSRASQCCHRGSRAPVPGQRALAGLPQAALEARRGPAAQRGRACGRRAQARHPFLDEAVQAALLGTPLPLLADLALPPGAGDKRLLRAILRALGLPRAAGRPKRAIQFGSRLGRASNVRDWGSNRAANAAGAGGVRLRDAGRP